MRSTVAPLPLARWRNPSSVLLGILVFVGALVLSGCSLLVRPTPTPMPTKWIRADPAVRANTLVLFLPGRGGVMNEFEENGFIDTLRAAGVRADVVIADAHLGYYLNRTVIDRLTADVLKPARDQGYQRIVAVGISLGGLGALLCERDQPHLLDANVLIAPYLGETESLFQEIQAAGGPAAWSQNRPLRIGEIDEQIWTYLGQHVTDLPPTWLVYGREDRLATGQRLLTTLLPANRTLTVSGKHNWKAWRTLWRQVCQDTELFSEEKKR